MKNFVFGLLLVLLTAVSLFADVRLPRMFSDNAVLQRNQAVPVWGWADPGEKVTVEFNDQKVETTTCEKGCWTVSLAPMAAENKGNDLIVRGKNTIKLANVAVGDVWVCSGKSNMEWALNSGSKTGRISATPDELNGDYGYVRYLRDAYIVNEKPQDNLGGGSWTPCVGGKQAGCTAIGFYFALRMHKELNITIGLIHCNWGGSKIESWMPLDAWNQLPKEMQTNITNEMAKRKGGQGLPCGMYNAKLHPWTRYAIKGALWYQGCSNGSEGETYFLKQKLMIESWRKAWGYDFPFYWVQLANYQKPNDDPNVGTNWAPLRDAQTACLSVPKTGQAVTIDVGETGDIHPRNKFDVGNRLAALSLVKDFGKQIPCESPLFKELKVTGNKALVTFDKVGSGLTAGKQVPRQFTADKNASVKRFAIAGADGKYYWGNAVITGKDTVEVTCPQVANPVSVRYAWQMNPEGCNLYSGEGFPATPFTATVK